MTFGDERAGSPGPPTPRPHVPEHAGPELMAGDTWGVDGATDDDVYQGRRRAAVLTNRRWIPVVAVLAGLALAVTVPIILSSSSPPPTGGTVTLTDQGGLPIGVDGTSSDVATSTGDATSEPATATPTTASRPTTTRPRTTTTKAPTTPAFAPITYQAEAASNTITGSAHVSDYSGASGGEIVRNIGDWGSSPDGALRFNGVTVPSAGSYTVTLYVVHIDNESTRTAFITVNGGTPMTVVVAGGSTCCATKTITVTLAKGTNTILIANPDDHAPSIDKIVIRRP